MTSLRVECKTRSVIRTAEVQMSVSEPISGTQSSMVKPLSRPILKEKLNELENKLSAVSDTESHTRTHLKDTITSHSSSIQKRTIFQNQYTHTRALANNSKNFSPIKKHCPDDDGSDSNTLSWLALFLILFASILLCLLVGILCFRSISSTHSDSGNESIVQTTISCKAESCDQEVADHVIKWLEDPVRHQPHDPVPLVPEDLFAHRLHMIQRAQAYGYDPLQRHTIHQLQHGDHCPEQSRLSWQLYSA